MLQSKIKEEGISALAEAMSAYIRDRLREPSWARKILKATQVK